MEFADQDQSNKMELLLQRLRPPALNLETLTFARPQVSEIEKFILRLPATNSAKTAQLLYGALRELNQLKLAPAAKLALIEPLQAHAISCADALTKNLSLNEQTMRSISTAQALLKHLLLGYKAVIAEAAQAFEVEPKLIAQAIHGAFVSMNRILLTCWQCYIAPPEKFWLELHTLYRIANYFYTDQQTVTWLEGGQKMRSTLTTAYLKPLLLSCANPGHYTPVEIKQVFTFLDKWAMLAELAPGHQEGLYVVDLDSDSGPVYASLAGPITANYVRLRNGKLVQALRDHFAREHNGDVKLITLPDRIVRNLCEYWDQEKVRTEEHLEDQTPVQVVLGLTAIHNELSGHSSVDEFLSDVDKHHNLKAYELFGENTSKLHSKSAGGEDAWGDSGYDTQMRHSESEEQTSATSAPPLPDTTVAAQRTTPRPPVYYQARQLNTSERGACIEFTEAPKQLSPGELIAIRDASQQDHNWTLGIIRWIHITPRLKRVAGIEKFQLAVEPCAACVISDQRATSPYLPGLLFQEQAHHKVGEQTLADAEVILPSMPFKQRNQISLLSNTREQRYILGDPTDTTFHLSRFKVKATAGII